MRVIAQSALFLRFFVCFIVSSATGRTIVANGSTYLNFASNNFLGLADRAEMKVRRNHNHDTHARPIHVPISPSLFVLLIAVREAFNATERMVTKDTDIKLPHDFLPSNSCICDVRSSLVY